MTGTNKTPQGLSFGCAGLPAIEDAVQIECRADQAQVGKGLRKVTQSLAAKARFFRVQAQVIRLAQAFSQRAGALGQGGRGRFFPPASMPRSARSRTC